MPAEFKMEGADKLKEVARALRKLSDKELSRDFYQRLNRLVKPLKKAIKDDLKSFLPDRYAEELARDLTVSSRRRAGRSPGIAIVGKAKSRSRGGERDLASLNRGRLRHPLFENRGWWYDQYVKPNFFDDPIFRQRAQVARQIDELLDEVAIEITRKIN